jgi:3-dehydroquinate synthase
MNGAMRKLAVELGARSYPIRIGAGSLSDPSNWHDTLSGKQVLVVSDEHVAPLYLDRVTAGLRDRSFSTLTLSAGEAHKTLDTAAKIFAALAELKTSRDATIIALGGGVIGDLAGFAAACWMRGIAFVQMPTTLLAMVDSSVGGKTGVDLPQGKNLVGAFHQPRAVIADTDTLSSLPDRELRAGFAEVIKYGALGDAQFFAWLETHADALLARDPHALADCIAHCCAQKAGIVARDETERGERALLNFGHTFRPRAGNRLRLRRAATRRSGGDRHASRRAIVGADGNVGGCGHAAPARAADPLRIADGDSRRNRCRCPARGDAARQEERQWRLRLILWRGVGRAEIAEGVDEGAIREVLRESG